MYTPSPHDSLQLDLWPEWLASLPWGGRNPRDLTRVHQGIIFKPEAKKDACSSVDPRQLELKLPGTNAPWQYHGAPLLKEI